MRRRSRRDRRDRHDARRDLVDGEDHDDAGRKHHLFGRIGERLLDVWGFRDTRFVARPDGSGEQEALAQVAAELSDGGELFDRLDPLGRSGQPERLGHGHDRGGDASPPKGRRDEEHTDRCAPDVGVAQHHVEGLGHGLGKIEAAGHALPGSDLLRHFILSGHEPGDGAKGLSARAGTYSRT